jgi:hypothetical protein
VSRADVTTAAAELTRCHAVALVLITQPDTVASSGPGTPTGSAPPWNAAAANAALDIHQDVRDLERDLRHAVTGHPGQPRGGSDRNTAAAIAAIVALAEAVTDGDASDAARRMTRRAVAVQQLPAVDEAERWQRISASCPYCGFPMLRVAPRSGQVTCLRYGDCSDADGHHPVGRLDVSRLTGDAIVAWADGRVTP